MYLYCENRNIFIEPIIKNRLSTNVDYCMLRRKICSRNDEKTAQDYKVQGGSVLHLVLALRGGY